MTTAPVSASAFDAFERLSAKGLNFRPLRWEQASENPDWRTDEATRTLAQERAGEPQPGGPFARAREGLLRYEFADPKIVRAIYDPNTPLEGRNMLLVGRFLHLRFHMGVRIGGVIDTITEDDGRRIHRFGWHYRTLEGHLEEGQMDYEIRKDARSGEVDFHVHGYSRPASIDNPIVRAGFALFGRRQQIRFYRNILDRMEDIANQGTVAESP